MKAAINATDGSRGLLIPYPMHPQSIRRNVRAKTCRSSIYELLPATLAQTKQSPHHKNLSFLEDLELLEAMLREFLSKRKAQKVTNILHDRYNNLWDVLNADARDLYVRGLDERTIIILRAVAEIVRRGFRSQIIGHTVFDNWNKVVDYCRVTMLHEKKEQVRLFFLDRQNRLLEEEIFQAGTIDQVSIYPREIVRRCIEVEAGAIIIAHNHPSGDPTPSAKDLDLTQSLHQVFQHLDIVLHDHLIIASQNTFSFRQQGLL